MDGFNNNSDDNTASSSSSSCVVLEKESVPGMLPEDIADDWNLLSMTNDSHDDDDWDVLSLVSLSSKKRLSDATALTYQDVLLASIHPGTASAARRSTKSQTKNCHDSDSARLLTVEEDTRRDSLAREPEKYDSLLFAKPMTDKLQKKHGRDGHRELLRGHTGRRRYISNRYHSREDWEMKVVKGRDSLACSSELELPFCSYCTCYAQSQTLNKRQQWDTVPEFLQAHSMTPPITQREKWRSGGGYRLATTFQLPVISRQAVATAPKPEDIYYTPPQPSNGEVAATPTNLFATVDKRKPSQLKSHEALSSWRVHHPEPRRYCSYYYSRPTVDGYSCWYPNSTTGTEGSDYLDIDLTGGKNTNVLLTAISTQGGRLPTRRYPQVNTSGRGYDIVEGRALDGKYQGPYWTVVDPKDCRKAQWVSSFDLLYKKHRAGSKQQWTSLGVFCGNEDATTEVPHVLPEELWCRYIRIVPRTVVNGGAMRLQVYTTPQNTVEYKLYQSLPHRHHHQVFDQQLWIPDKDYDKREQRRSHRRKRRKRQQQARKDQYNYNKQS